ncbi:phage regulatory CII family protein [Nitrosomonas ureae]|uniref:Uncharacterized protein n=1 Tax=Nitrosomonas ureae TaxID=44577 RepID=A0A2T5IST7_9PROT|nr:phage regulatory CII family protein [Nitrosomonas ureae]PTQ86893.1 hypothetical protein C8R28_100888 [Nitrosomonas ureae]
MRHSSRLTKQIYRSLFLSLQADAKKFPGGITALAGVLGMNPTTLANHLNPDHEALPPSFSVLLEIIIHCQAKATIFSLAYLIGQATIDVDLSLEQTEPKCQVKTFLSLVASTSTLLKEGSDAAQDFHFDASERQKLRPLLLHLMQITTQLYNSFNE